MNQPEETWRCPHGWLRGEQCEMCKETMDKDKALKLALAALENHCGNYKLDDEGVERFVAACKAIKEALAQPEQEPVEDVVAYHSDGTRTVRIAPKRPWVGLNEQDFSAINQSCLTKLQAATSAESILKEKNAP